MKVSDTREGSMSAGNAYLMGILRVGLLVGGVFAIRMLNEIYDRYLASDEATGGDV